MSRVDYQRLLKLAERALRPGSTAMRVQAQELARTADGLSAVVARLAETNALLASALAQGPSPAEAPAVASHNSSDDAMTFEIIGRVLGRADNAIDVGANEGLVLERILEVAPDGHHSAFEPISAMAASLAQRYPHVDVHAVALSDEEGEATFHHVVSNPSYSGLLQRRYDRPHEDVEITKVRTARLDDLIPHDRPISFVKIDVEGAELGVLKGAMELLKRNRPVVAFEHGLGAADFYGTRPEQVWDIMAGCGLDIFLLRSWLNSNKPLTLEQFVDEFESNRTWFFLAAPPA